MSNSLTPVTSSHSGNSYADLLVVWVATLFGHFTLSDAVLWLTLFYTAIKLFLLVRDDLLPRRKKP